MILQHSAHYSLASVSVSGTAVCSCLVPSVTCWGPAFVWSQRSELLPSRGRAPAAWAGFPQHDWLLRPLVASLLLIRGVFDDGPLPSWTQGSCGTARALQLMATLSLGCGAVSPQLIGLGADKEQPRARTPGGGGLPGCRECCLSAQPTCQRRRGATPTEARGSAGNAAVPGHPLLPRQITSLCPRPWAPGPAPPPPPWSPIPPTSAPCLQLVSLQLWRPAQSRVGTEGAFLGAWSLPRKARS